MQKKIKAGVNTLVCNFLAKNDLEAVVVHSGGHTIEEIAIALSVAAHSSGK